MKFSNNWKLLEEEKRSAITKLANKIHENIQEIQASTLNANELSDKLNIIAAKSDSLNSKIKQLQKINKWRNQSDKIG